MKNTLTYDSSYFQEILNSNDFEEVLDQAYELRHSDLNKAFDLANICLDWSISNKNSVQQNGSNSLLAILYAQCGELKKAAVLVDLVLTNGEIVEDKYIARSYLSAGIVFRKMNQSSKSLKCLKKAKEHYFRIGNESGLAVITNEIAIWHLDNGDAFRALNKLRKLMNEGQVLKSGGILGETNFLMSRCCLKILELKAAKNYALTAFELNEEIGNERGLPKIYDLILKIATELGDDSLHAEYELRGKAFMRTVEDPFVAVHLGSALLKNTKFLSERDFTDLLYETLLIVEENEVSELFGEVYSLASKYCEEINDLENALLYQKKCTAVMVEEKSRYQAIEMELEVVLQELQREKNNNDILEVSNKKLIESKREKIHLIQEINHRVRNNLQIIMTLIKHSDQNIGYETGKIKLLERTTIISLAHDHLTSVENIRMFKIESYIRKVVHLILGTKNCNSITVDLSFNDDVYLTALDKCIPLGFIVYESICHSLASWDKKTTDVLKFKISMGKFSGFYYLTVQDNLNNHYFSENNVEEFSSYGLINGFAEQLTADLKIEGQDYTKVSVIFKK